MRRNYILLLAFAFLMVSKASAQNNEDRLKIQLHSALFSDTFLVIFKENGRVEINDQDAPKVGEGYLCIAGFSIGGPKLAIEERPFPLEDLDLPFSVKAFASGNYTLNIARTGLKIAKAELTLYDRFLHQKILIGTADYSYAFNIDTAVVASQGENRFSLLLHPHSDKWISPVNKDAMTAFPNPCLDKLFLNVSNFSAVAGEVFLKDLLGKVLWRKEFKEVKDNEVLELECQQLPSGIYLLEWRNGKKGKILNTLKIIKQ